MPLRLGLRSRILMLTLPVIMIGYALSAGIIYLILGNVLAGQAQEHAATEVEATADFLGLHTISDLLPLQQGISDRRVLQIVDATGAVVANSHPAATQPLVDPSIPPGVLQTVVIEDVPGLDEGEYAVASALVTDRDDREYAVIVAVATESGAALLGPMLEFGLVIGVVLIALLISVTTIAVRQALRPVERMRAQIEVVATSRLVPELEVPAGRDELTRLAETLNGVLARLRRADTSRRAFVADAGHELRSPLATIRVLVDRLAVEGAPEQRRTVATRADAEVDRLSVLVDDLLTLAAADEQAMTLRATDVDLDDVVLEETGALRARGMPITVTVEPVRVQGDGPRLGRVVRNLLENAERHRTDVVRVTLTRGGAFALLVVDNDGAPVAPEDRRRIFARFVRLDDSRTRDTGGTGLGLAIVAEIVRAHGGRAVAEDSPEGWCRFSVRIPLETRPG